MFNILGLWLGLFYLFALAVYWLQLGGENYILIRNTIFLFPPLFAFIAAAYTVGSFGLKGTRAKTFMLLAGGMGSFFVGEALFYFYEFVLNTNPFPSMADFFYLFAYPLLFCALINEIRQTNVDWKKLQPSSLFPFFISLLALSAIVMYFGVYKAYDDTLPFLNTLFTIGYGIADLLLIVANMLVIILAWEFRGGRLSRMWTMLFIGFIFMLIADMLFASYSGQYDNEVWFYRSLIDSLYMLSYLLFAWGLFDIGLSLHATRKSLKQSPSTLKKPTE